MYLCIHTVYSHHQLNTPDPPAGAGECNSIITSSVQPPKSKCAVKSQQWSYYRCLYKHFWTTLLPPPPNIISARIITNMHFSITVMPWKVFTSWNLHNVILLSIRSCCAARQLEKSMLHRRLSIYGGPMNFKISLHYQHVSTRCMKGFTQCVHCCLCESQCLSPSVTTQYLWLLHSDADKYNSFIEYDTMLIGNLLLNFQMSLVALSSFFLGYR